MTQTLASYTAPNIGLLQTEAVRAGFEFTRYLCALPRLSEGPPGDGHHVLVLPGLMAGDPSTLALRHLIRARGYVPHGWGRGLNIGPTLPRMEGLVSRLGALYERDNAPVSLVGWSLGGVLARELARSNPDKVRCVITLGSPFRLTARHSPYATHAGWVYHALKPLHTDLFDHGLPEEDLPPLRVPSTSIYSRLDGIVPWEACQDLPGERRENVEVAASHFGMGTHRDVLTIVLDRLAQQPDAWVPYGAPVSLRPELRFR